MKFYLIDDDRNILNVLKQIITDRGLGTICGCAQNGRDGLEDFEREKPDIVIVDVLMPEMDGISLVQKAKPLLPNTAFIMLSQVSSKDMIASAYEAGAEFFIQKPVNSVEVENVIRKVQDSLNMQRTMQKVQNIFMTDMNAPMGENLAATGNDLISQEAVASIKTILQRLGIIGDTGSKDILAITEYLISHHEQMEETTLSELCGKFSSSPKSMEQRIRRAANAGLVNLAHLGIEDYGNDIFVEYSNTLYNFEQVRREMDFIRGKGEKHGNVKIKNFLNSLVSYSMERREYLL